MSSHVAVTLVAGFLGFLVGSFANAAIHRWPRGGGVTSPAGSRCPACDAPVAPRDNIPLVSYVLLRGRCRSCRSPIGVRYPLVEASVAILWATTAWVHGLEPVLPASLVFVWALVVATAIDLEFRIIPNRLTYPLVPILLGLLVVAAGMTGEWVDLRRALLAGVAIPGVMLLLSEAFRLLRGQVGIGMGDIKLSVSIGLVVGYLGGWEIVVFAYGTMVAGVLVATALLATGRAKLASRIPYGPYLALGALLAIMAGPSLGDALAAWLGI